MLAASRWRVLVRLWWASAAVAWVWVLAVALLLLGGSWELQRAAVLSASRLVGLLGVVSCGGVALLAAHYLSISRVGLLQPTTGFFQRTELENLS
jgi:hypothetical protein